MGMILYSGFRASAVNLLQVVATVTGAFAGAGQLMLLAWGKPAGSGEMKKRMSSRILPDF